MDIELIENSIKDKLSSESWAAASEVSPGPPPVTEQVKIITLPETDSQNERNVFKRGRIIVGFKDVVFDKTKATGKVAQNGEVEVTVTVEALKLRGDYGIYDFYKKVRKSLLGFDPEDCDKLWMKSFGFVDYEAGVWIYEMCLSAPTMIVQQDDEVPLSPGPAQITVNTSIGNGQ